MLYFLIFIYMTISKRNLKNISVRAKIALTVCICLLYTSDAADE